MTLDPNSIWKLEERVEHAVVLGTEDPIDKYKDFDWQNSTPTDWVNFAKAGPWPEPGITRDECWALAHAMEVYGNRPMRIFEIGQCFGCSTRLFLGKVLRDGGEIHSCEINVREPFKQKMIELGLWDRIITHQCHSQMIHWTDGIDMLFVDGEHCLEDALGEYFRFRRWMVGERLVGFHDAESCFGVRRALDIIANEVDQIQLVSQQIGQGSSGLKVFRINSLGMKPGHKSFVTREQSLGYAYAEVGDRLKP